MNLEAFGMIGLPLYDEAARMFWEGIASERLVLPRCSGCGRWQWYPTNAGPCCTGAHLHWIELPGTGTVFTFTVVRHPFLPELAAALPLTVALLELDGTEDMRFVALLDLEVPAIGDRVRMRVVEAGGRRFPIFCTESP